LSHFPIAGIRIAGNTLHKGLTQEVCKLFVFFSRNQLNLQMTRREIKFALQVESILNLIPEPEYRELIVEVSAFHYFLKGQGLSYKVGLKIQIFWSQKIP